MSLKYVSKKQHGSIQDSVNSLLSSGTILNRPNYNQKYQTQLQQIIGQLSSSPLFGTDLYGQTPREIAGLQSELSTHISRLFDSECDPDDLQYFQAKFEKSLLKFENSLMLQPDGSGSFSNVLESIYLEIVRPLLMKLMGAIVGLFMSPILPCSSSARAYVGSFFKSPLGNMLSKEFQDLRSDITKDAVAKNEALEVSRKSFR